MILSPISLFIVYDKWEPGQRLTLLILTYTSAALSLLSCIFILYALTILYKLRANSIRRLVFYMVWADMGAAITWLIAASLEPSSTSAISSSFSYPASTPTSPFSTSALDTNGTDEAGRTVIEWGGIDWGCRLVAPLQVYFCLASIFWATNIATETVWRMGHVTFTPMGEIKLPNESSPYTCAYQIFAWALPFLVILQPMNCSETGKITLMWVYMAIVVAVWVYCVLAYAVGMIGFNKKLQQAEINGTYTRTEQERTERLQIRWAGYLVVYIMTWAFVLPLNVVQFWGTEQSTVVFVFTAIGCVTLPAMGMFNTIVYGCMPSYKQSALLKQLYLHLVGLGRCRYGSHVGEEEHTKLVQKGTPPRNYGNAGVGVYYSSDDDDDYWER